MHLNHPETIPSSQPPPPLLQKNCLPQNWSLMPKQLGTADIHDIFINSSMLHIASLFLQVGSLGIEWLVFCFSSITQSCPTLCNPVDCSTPGFPVHHQLLEFTQTHVHWVGDAIQPSYPLSSPSPPASIFPRIRVFSNESILHIRWPQYCSFSFSISPSNEYSGLIFFGIDWFDLAVQGTHKSLLQHRSSKASILQNSAFFIVQLSHPYMTTGKTIALTRQTFVGKVTSLLFNMLSRLVIAFLPRSECLLISWLLSPSTVVLEPQNIRSLTLSIVSSSVWFSA